MRFDTSGGEPASARSLVNLMADLTEGIDPHSQDLSTFRSRQVCGSDGLGPQRKLYARDCQFGDPKRESFTFLLSEGTEPISVMVVWGPHLDFDIVQCRTAVVDEDDRGNADDGTIDLSVAK